MAYTDSLHTYWTVLFNESATGAQNEQGLAAAPILFPGGCVVEEFGIITEAAGAASSNSLTLALQRSTTNASGGSFNTVARMTVPLTTPANRRLIYTGTVDGTIVTVANAGKPISTPVLPLRVLPGERLQFNITNAGSGGSPTASFCRGYIIVRLDGFGGTNSSLTTTTLGTN